jgi:maltooligosyltrehalose trehalohydrolase
MLKQRTPISRHIPVGAEPSPDGNATRFRVWAPEHPSVAVVFDGHRHPAPLKPEENGYFSGLVENVPAGTRYKYQLGNDPAHVYPDPASRYQPRGPHHFSEVIDPRSFEWTDESWPGVRLPGQVIYELHVGTFTTEGTWKAASEKLRYLKDTGITVIELMPVADFPGKFGWGYDGVQLFAPASIYGTPDDMRAFVNRAHAFGLGVVLDVVYNHLGPDGNYLGEFSPFYFSDRYKTDWGAALNFDGRNNQPVREFFLQNAIYWIREFHIDGLRLDATQDIHDSSEPHILTELSCVTREAAAPRSIILIGENEPQHTQLLRSLDEGGCGLDALWNDDYHHTAMVALTGKSEAYYSDYRGTPQEFVSAVKYGYLYQGQFYRWQNKNRGTPTFGLPHAAMVNFIQNHDQIANSLRGQRIHEVSHPGTLRALTALTLLAPGTPMLFQGQEFGASSRFSFFADHKPELAKLVKKGRVEFLQQWPSLATPEMQNCFSDPASFETFESSRLDHSEVRQHAGIYALHRDLLRLRREDPVISRQGEDGLDGAVLSPDCFLVRFFSAGHLEDRILLVNLGVDLEFRPAPEPLLAPPPSRQWTRLWSTDDSEYGGCGTPPVEPDEGSRIPGRAAVLLHPVPSKRKPSKRTPNG